MKPDKFLCSRFLLPFFGLEHAKPTIAFELCLNNRPIEMLPFRIIQSCGVIEKKEEIVHGRSMFNINCTSFVIAFELCCVS